MRFLFLFFMLLLPPLSGDEYREYGWHLPKTPLYLGGYLSLQYDKEEKSDLAFDDIALLFYANFDKYHILGEVEAADIPLKDTKKSNTHIYIERAQLSYDIDEYSTITIGKFNSDIGFWNLSPINTLTDTTSSPYLLQKIFPQLTTGLLYNRSFAQEERALTITIQHNRDIDTYNNLFIDRHYGFGLSYLGFTHIWKINGGYLRNKEHQKAFYGGIAYQKESTLWTIQSELFTKQSRDEKDIPYDLYLQFTRHLNNQHDLIFRQEFYKDNTIQTKEGISLIGYTYRPRPFITLKGEYLKHSSLPKSRFIFSFSVVF